MNSPPAISRKATRMVTAATSDSTFEIATPISDSASGDRWVFRIGGGAAIAGLDDDKCQPAGGASRKSPAAHDSTCQTNSQTVAGGTAQVTKR